MKKYNTGFSLIEVLIFISILSLVFISAVIMGTISVRNSKNAENKILAARYGEELKDWLHGDKSTDWSEFVAKSGDQPPGEIYCFYQEPVSVWPTSTGSCNSNQLINSTFARSATLLYDVTTERVNVDIHIEWSEGGNDYDVPIQGLFSPFE